MEDPILSAYLADFSKSYDLSNASEAIAFEYFTAYCVFMRDFPEAAALDDLIVSGGNDTGIDAVGIFINDILVNTRKQIDDIANRQKIDATFCFIQAKTSKSLSVAEIGSYIQGVKEFFGPRFMSTNETIKDKRGVSDYVFENSVKMRGKPRLVLYYCYSGRFHDDPNVAARVQAGKHDIEKMNLFSDIEFHFIDSDRLQSRYQEINLRIDREVVINEFAYMPAIPGIRQAFLGVIRCEELVKLLSNSDGKLHKALFNENVRDFLNRTPVNDEIEETIRSQERQGRLAALNNGITIVAKGIKTIGKKFTISDFQIVNGCQTSHIIFANRGRLHKETSIPLKLIEADDRDIVNEIVRATNRQTEVKDEAFVVLGDFHKRIERFFLNVDQDSDNRIVYERRKRQYADSAYTNKNIVSLPALTNSFVSCFMENPVDANDYYGVTLSRYSGQIFLDGHSIWPYLASATILKEIEKLCVGRARSNLWKFRFIISMLVRRSFGSFGSLKDDGAQRKYAEKIIALVRDSTEFTKLVSRTESFIARAVASSTEIDVRNIHQDRTFVESLKRKDSDL